MVSVDAMMWSKWFPLLKPNNHRRTSDPTPDYNCIAWAAGDASIWWWPDQAAMCYWPEGVAREETLAAFVAAYGTLGYALCDDNGLEKGLEKIAIYAKNGVPTHAARQLKNGEWTSKLGRHEDIEHALGALEGSEYGKVAIYLSRVRAPVGSQTQESRHG